MPNIHPKKLCSTRSSSRIFKDSDETCYLMVQSHAMKQPPWLLTKHIEGFESFYLKARTRFWSRLSYCVANRSMAVLPRGTLGVSFTAKKVDAIKSLNPTPDTYTSNPQPKLQAKAMVSLLDMALGQFELIALYEVDILGSFPQQ